MSRFPRIFRSKLPIMYVPDAMAIAKALDDYGPIAENRPEADPSAELWSIKRPLQALQVNT